MCPTHSFCFQLLDIIFLLYSLIFFHALMTDPIVMIMMAFWTFVQTYLLSVTAASGILVNHYVRKSEFHVLM